MIRMIDAAKIGVATVLAIALSACATKLGRNFDDVYAQQIKPGETTKAEVRQKLGGPVLLSRSGDEETWTYAYYVGRNLALEDFNLFREVDPETQGQGSQKRLVVTFKGDVVKNSKFTVELPRYTAY